MQISRRGEAENRKPSERGIKPGVYSNCRSTSRLSQGGIYTIGLRIARSTMRRFIAPDVEIGFQAIHLISVNISGGVTRPETTQRQANAASVQIGKSVEING